MAIKILLGGSPCQHWSIAKGVDREKKAEGMGWELFKNYLIAKEKFQPDIFLYENNKSAAQAIKDQIASELGVGTDPNARFTYINSALVSAQNRQRFYVTNFGDIEQPKDRGIIVKDILEPGAIRDQLDRDKTRTLTAGYMVCSQRDLRMDIETGGFMGKEGAIEPVNVTANGKSQTLKAQYINTSVRNICCYKSTYGASGVAESVRVGWLPRHDGEIRDHQHSRIYSIEGKSTNLNANGGGLGAKTGLYAIPVEFENGVPTKAISCGDGKTYTVYEVKDGYITIRDEKYPIKLADGFYIIRKLTVTECCRLQTLPDDYAKAVSVSQAYKGLGNGWTAEIIIHILNHALKDVPRDEELIVLSMYDGIGTGLYCLKKMGFTNIKYHAYENDPYPIQIAMDNHPEIIQRGDAFEVRNENWRLE